MSIRRAHRAFARAQTAVTAANTRWEAADIDFREEVREALERAFPEVRFENGVDWCRHPHTLYFHVAVVDDKVEYMIDCIPRPALRGEPAVRTPRVLRSTKSWMDALRSGLPSPDLEAFLAEARPPRSRG